jgi:glucuronate isomerase
MDHESLREAVLPLPVWDTHTHLIGSALPARDFWEIGHYFWFLRELQAAGYPTNADALPKPARIDAFVRAFQATRTTAMHWTVRRIFQDLYGVTLTDAASVRQADAAVRARAAEADWSQRVASQGGVRRIVVNQVEDADFRGLPSTSCVVPRVEAQLGAWLAQLANATDPRAAGDEIAAALATLFTGYVAAGYGGVMTSLEPFTALAGPLALPPGTPVVAGFDRANQEAFLLHSLCQAAEAHGLFVQFFLGIEAGWGGGRAPVNDPRRVLRLYGLFERYRCPFELVLGTDLNNLDAVQAAVIFPHVHVGGMWWYNFRLNTYRASFGYRLEALPPAKSPIVVSDARCIEWCYGKVMLIKHLLAEFLSEQVARGWLGHDDAVWVARTWLHDAAAARYDGLVVQRPA